jgi:hypothetical protein
VLNFESLYAPPPPPVYRDVKDKDMRVLTQSLFRIFSAQEIARGKIAVDDPLLIDALTT